MNSIFGIAEILLRLLSYFFILLLTVVVTAFDEKDVGSGTSVVVTLVLEMCEVVVFGAGWDRRRSDFNSILKYIVVKTIVIKVKAKKLLLFMIT